MADMFRRPWHPQQLSTAPQSTWSTITDLPRSTKYCIFLNHSHYRGTHLQGILHKPDSLECCSIHRRNSMSKSQYSLQKSVNLKDMQDTTPQTNNRCPICRKYLRTLRAGMETCCGLVPPLPAKETSHDSVIQFWKTPCTCSSGSFLNLCNFWRLRPVLELSP